MHLLKANSRGENVKSLQERLTTLGYKPGPVDGAFGQKTEQAVIRFQIEHNLYADGVVGPNTWSALDRAIRIHLDEQLQPAATGKGQMPWVRVPADKYRNGYDRFFLRQDAAEAYLRVRTTILEAGGQLTSSGARRALNAHVNPSRSATSFHYTGRALDLFVGSGMENRRQDPYVITADQDRYWRVYAKAPGGEQMELEAITYGSRKAGRPISGRFIDLTALFQTEGFQPIQARRSFLNGGSWLGAEWWHFQYETGLEKGVSTFGNELLQVYSEEELQATPPWNYRHRVFGVDWF